MPHLLLTIVQFIQAGLASTCTTLNCRNAADMMVQNRDVHQDHCLNFYEYACANYRATHQPVEGGLERGMYTIQNRNMDAKLAEVLGIVDDTALPDVQTARAAYRKCLTTSHRSTAVNDCLVYMKRKFPRVLLYLLATPEVYAEREKIRVMMAQIKLTYINTIQNSWLDDNKKSVFINQLNNLGLIIGFTPDMIQPNNLLAPYGDPYILFGTSSSFYPTENTIMVPIADFFFPSYRLGLEVLHFATLGFAVAHEMSHNFDMHLDVRAANGWLTWSANMQNSFLQKRQCLREQYNQFTVQQQPIGELTLAENIADNVGFKLALDSYRTHRRFRGAQKKLIRFENYSQEKLFMLAFANKWCESVTMQVHVTDLWTGHAPAPARVNAVLMNSPNFGNLWNCPLNSPMNPAHKCSIFDP